MAVRLPITTKRLDEEATSSQPPLIRFALDALVRGDASKARFASPPPAATPQPLRPV
jgi:hypothetical protein